MIASSESKSLEQVRWLRDDELALWDALVKRNSKSLIYQSSEWRRILEQSFPQMRGRLLGVFGDQGELVGGTPVYVVRSWLMGPRIISIPLGSVSDLLLTRPQAEKCLPLLMDLYEKCSAKRMEFRSLRSMLFPEESGFVTTVEHKHHYLPLAGTVDTIKATFSNNITRLINKAVKSGFTVRKATGLADVNVFFQLFSATRKRLSLPPIPFHFFKNLFEQSDPNHFSLFLAYSKDDPIAGVWISRYKGVAALEFTGEAPDVRSSGVSQLLYWSAILEAIEEKREMFSFGRTALDNAGLLDHKRRWGTVEEDLYFAKYEPGQGEGDAKGRPFIGYRIAKRLAGKLPDPLFHLMGKFCFRHWA